MKVLVIGSHGRDHALAWRLTQSASVTKVYASPGNAGIARDAECVGVGYLLPWEYVALAKSLGVAFTVVGPAEPLVAGVVDAFEAAGLLIVGPTAAAAQLEGSKTFAKHVMTESGVPTARFVEATDYEMALTTLKQFSYPVVIKADGLALGKGVVIANDRAEAVETIAQFLSGSHGDAGKRIVFEEFLVGEEVSFIVLTDGASVLAMEPSQDHKRFLEEDKGPNTGGMGAYCDSRILTAGQHEEVIEKVIEPTLHTMRKRGTPFFGFLYAGLMMTADGVKALEFNCRSGDPETQSILLRMGGDLGEILLASAQRRLTRVEVSWKPDPSICLVLTTQGYPGKVRTGDVITGFEEAEAAGAKVFHAATLRSGNQILTAGGRILGVTVVGKTLQEAIDRVYKVSGYLHFDGMQFRRDIGRKGLKRW